MPDETRPPLRGYHYRLSDEAILKYMGWSIETRLTWLEEANRFLWMAMSPEARRIRAALRSGEP